MNKKKMQSGYRVLFHIYYNITSFIFLQQFVLFCSLSFTCHCMTNNHYLNLYQNPVDTSFVFIRWSNLYIFQTSIASISSSFVGEGVVW